MRYAGIFLFIVMTAGVIWIVFNEGENTGNPYEYNVDVYKKTDKTLVLYEEKSSVKLPMEPSGIAVHSNIIYICGNQKLLLLGKENSIIKETSLPGKANCISISKEGKMYIGFKDYVAVYSKKLVKLAAWKKFKKKSLLTSIVAVKNYVFVADAGMREVLRFNLQGEIEKRIKKPRFIIPSPYFDMVLGAHDSLWIVNPGKHKIGNYTYDGELKFSWGKSSKRMEGFCGCCNPTNIAWLPGNMFVTSEKHLPRIKIYNSRGKFIGVVAGVEKFHDETAGLDLAIDHLGRILVIDPLKHTMRIFVKVKK